mmetsp:Transcript_67476/g.163119  ORF Transcript_67476/g.163119 Transcript_67476/m.163119 type:complete len:212 (+) Transcript_67476:960-1595(+)
MRSASAAVSAIASAFGLMPRLPSHAPLSFRLQSSSFSFFLGAISSSEGSGLLRVPALASLIAFSASSQTLYPSSQVCLPPSLSSAVHLPSHEPLELQQLATPSAFLPHLGQAARSSSLVCRSTFSLGMISSRGGSGSDVAGRPTAMKSVPSCTNSSLCTTSSACESRSRCALLQASKPWIQVCSPPPLSETVHLSAHAPPELQQLATPSSL